MEDKEFWMINDQPPFMAPIPRWRRSIGLVGGIAHLPAVIVHRSEGYAMTACINAGRKVVVHLKHGFVPIDWARQARPDLNGRHGLFDLIEQRVRDAYKSARANKS